MTSPSKSGLPPLPDPEWVTALNTPLPKPPKSTAHIRDPPGFSKSKAPITGKQVCSICT